MKIQKLLLLSCTLLSACASMVNTKYTKVKVSSETPFVVLNDSTDNDRLSTQHTVYVLRADSDHTLLLASDSITIARNLPVKMDEMVMMNALLPGIGLLGLGVDHWSKLGYTYPRKLSVQFSATDTTKDDYFTGIPQEKMWVPKNNVKLTPLKLFGFDNPGIEVCYEHPFSKRFSLQTMGSKLYTPLGTMTALPQSGYRVAVEPRFFITGNVDRGFYISLEANYMQKKKSDVREYAAIPYDANSPDSLYWQSFYSDTVLVNKQTFSLNQKFGFQFTSGAWVFDVYAGMGLRLKSVDISNRIRPQDEPRLRAESFEFDRQGTYFTLSMPLNFRIGFRF